MITPSLRPLKSEPNTYELIALDSEGSGKRGDFKIAVTYDSDGPHIFYNRSQLKRWLFRSANLNKIILAANLEYDYAVCFQPFDGNFDILLSNRRWMSASYRDNNKHVWRAWDIQRIAPLSVAQMGKVINLPKLSTPPELVEDTRYKPDEWTCADHHKIFCVECYCVRDAEITYKFSVMYQQSLNALGAQMKLTAASCAMDLFRRRFLLDEIPATNPENNLIARQAYYGGRVEAFHIGTTSDVKAYDFNSLYPSVMMGAEVAIPSSYIRHDRLSNPHKYMDNFGQFFGTVHVPDYNVGLLPFRSEGRLYFPVGNIRGSWMLSELRHALEHGAIIKDCESIIYARKTIRPFDDYIRTLYDIRLEHKQSNNPSEIVDKLLMNSLYGKFAQHDDGGLQSLLMPEDGFSLDDFIGCEPVEIAGREMFLRDKNNIVQSPHIHVLWAAEITARARIKLLSALLPVQYEAVYCDTDSVHTFSKLDTSINLGGLKVEHDFARVTYFAPKEYGGQDQNGEFVHRAKGIPPAYRSEYLAKGAVEFKQPIHTLTAIRRGKRIAEWVTVEKHRRSDAMNRSHRPVPDFNAELVPTFPFEAGTLTGD